MTENPARVGPEHAVQGLVAPVWFVVSFAAYVGVALAWKSVVLNWIVGPLWLLVTLYIVPRGAVGLLGRIRR